MPPLTKDSQIGSLLPISRTNQVKVEELGTLTDEELTALANSNQRAFVGSLRQAIVANVRIAGAALCELKQRLEHGDWSAWLKAHFKGSPETARLYMRIAREWDFVVQHG